MSARASRLLLAALLIVVFPACAWYPYDWRSAQVRNGARLPAGGPLGLRQPGVARSIGAAAWLADVRRAQRFEVLLRVRPWSREGAARGAIFTIADDSQRNLTIAQQGSSLCVGLREEPELVVPHVFQPDEWVSLRAIVTRDRLSVTVEGREATRRVAPRSSPAAWDESYAVALGNELAGDRPWLGEIARAEIGVGGAPIDLLSSEQLTLPRLVRSYHHRPKLIPLRRLGARDALVNVLGFVPFGWALNFAFDAPIKLAGAALAGFAVSFVLEAAQLWLPTRFPSIDDVLLNTLGSVVGFSLARAGLLNAKRCE